MDNVMHSDLIFKGEHIRPFDVLKLSIKYIKDSGDINLQELLDLAKVPLNNNAYIRLTYIGMSFQYDINAGHSIIVEEVANKSGIIKLHPEIIYRGGTYLLPNSFKYVFRLYSTTFKRHNIYYIVEQRDVYKLMPDLLKSTYIPHNEKNSNNLLINIKFIES